MLICFRCFNKTLILANLAQTLINSQESTSNASRIAFLVKFTPLFKQIIKIFSNKHEIDKRIIARNNFQQQQLEKYNSAKNEALSFDNKTKEAIELVQLKDLKAIEHYEVFVQLEKDLAFLKQDKEFI